MSAPVPSSSLGKPCDERLGEGPELPRDVHRKIFDNFTAQELARLAHTSRFFYVGYRDRLLTAEMQLINKGTAALGMPFIMVLREAITRLYSGPGTAGGIFRRVFWPRKSYYVLLDGTIEEASPDDMTPRALSTPYGAHVTESNALWRRAVYINFPGAAGSLTLLAGRGLPPGFVSFCPARDKRYSGNVRRVLTALACAFDRVPADPRVTPKDRSYALERVRWLTLALKKPKEREPPSAPIGLPSLGRRRVVGRGGEVQDLSVEQEQESIAAAHGLAHRYGVAPTFIRQRDIPFTTWLLINVIMPPALLVARVCLAVVGSVFYLAGLSVALPLEVVMHGVLAAVGGMDGKLGLSGPRLLPVWLHNAKRVVKLCTGD